MRPGIRWFVTTLAVSCTAFGAAPAYAQSADDGFNPGANATVMAMVVQPDGKILAGGDFSVLGSAARSRIGRLLNNGAVDPGFDPGADGSVRALALQPDGKILVGGAFTALGGDIRRFLGRLNADGSLDLFDPIVNPGAVFALAVQPNGQILLGGSFTSVLFELRFRIARLDANGLVDFAFNPGANGEVRALAVQPDGKILVGGTFTGLGGTFGTTPRSAIGRLNPNGTVDATFNPGALGSVSALALQSNGKILVGGDFTMLGGGSRSRIGRLNADGTLDATFDPGANGPVSTLAVQSNGMILAGGSFSTLGGGGTGTAARSRIGRLNADGTLDPSFDPGADGDVAALALQPDGKVLAGGSFTMLGGGGAGTTPRSFIGRLTNTGPAIETLSVGPGPWIFWERGGAAPVLSRVTFEWSTDGVTYQPSAVAPSRLPTGWAVMDFALPQDQAIFVRARGFYPAGQYNGSGAIVETIRYLYVSSAAPELVQNGDFNLGMTGWSVFEVPDIVHNNAAGGVFEFYKQSPTTTASGQAVVFQHTGVPLPAGAPLTANFDLGNSSSVRKRVTVVILDSNFSDLYVCTFFLEPNAPLRPYAIRTHTNRAWANAAIYFYAASGGSNGGNYRIDNVSLRADGMLGGTECYDPTVDANGVQGPNLLLNSLFDTGLPPWGVFGTITWQIANGVFEFHRPSATPPAGVLFQSVGPMAQGQKLVATFQLGNTSLQRRRVTVLLNDADFSDLVACTFWLAPDQPLSDYIMLAVPSKAWGNAMLSFYSATVGAFEWVQVDNVTLARQSGSETRRTVCAEPPLASLAGTNPTGEAAGPPAAAAAARPGGVATKAMEAGAARQPDAAAALSALEGGATRALMPAIDLRGARSAEIAFVSRLPAGASRGEVQLSLDGITWVTVAAVAGSDEDVATVVDLGAFVGRVVFWRLDRTSGVPGPWLVREVAIRIGR